MLKKFQAVYMSGEAGYKGRPPRRGGHYKPCRSYIVFYLLIFFSFHMVVSLFLKGNRR